MELARSSGGHGRTVVSPGPSTIKSTHSLSFQRANLARSAKALGSSSGGHGRMVVSPLPSRKRSKQSKLSEPPVWPKVISLMEFSPALKQRTFSGQLFPYLPIAQPDSDLQRE